MKKAIIIFLFSGLFFMACEKSKKEDTLYIRGRLVLTDTITANTKEQPLSGATVRLTDNLADTLNYRYSANTGSDGYFTFNLLNESYPYQLRYQAVINGYTYIADRKVNEGENNISMVARLDLSKQNGFLCYAVDSTVNAGAIPTATALVYSSEVLANSNDPAGAVYTLNTDPGGKLFKLNIPAGRYFINIRKQSGSIILQRMKKIIDVPLNGISGYPVKDTIVVRQ